MSVSVNTVYQRVLAILNKEQRGYVTPQEFNLFANQAQMDLFEQYFYDINQFGRIQGNDTEFSDMLTILNEKINPFEATVTMVANAASYLNVPAAVGAVSTDLYRIGTIMYTNIEVERINQNEFLYVNASPLTRPTDNRPIFVASSNGYKVYGADVVRVAGAAKTQLITVGVSCNYIKRPAAAVWGFTVVNGVALYNVATSTDFPLHASEETELVIKILEFASLSVRDMNLYQVSNQMEGQNTQQEKS